MTQLAADIVARLAVEQDFTAQLRARAAAVGARVALPEAPDPRVIAAAIALKELGVAEPVLVGDRRGIQRALSSEGVDPGVFEIVDPAQGESAERVGARLFELRREKGLTQGESFVLAKDPLHLGAGLVALGHSDAMVAGSVHSTPEVIRAGLWHVGLAPGIAVVSGAFLMVPPSDHIVDHPLLFADSAVVPAPDDEQLVSIGKSSAQTYLRLTGRVPRVACLSFSTKGSAEHPRAARMAKLATRLVDEGLDADGELQLDAALLPAIGEQKAPGSPVAGRADVLLFPDLDAGNIGYKMAQRLGGFAAIGPIVQGLRRPVFDLSRGCSAIDIVNTVALAALLGVEN